MKTCIITSQYGSFSNGAGTYATNLINYLAAANHDITVICPENEHIKPQRNIRIVNIRKTGVKPAFGNWFIISYYFNETLRDLLAKESFDIIHFADARESFFCKTTDIPVIGTMHDYLCIEASKNPFFYKKHFTDWFKRWLFYNFTRAMERRAVKKLSFIIANSNYVMESLVKNYSVRDKNIKTVYIGIETAETGGENSEKNKLQAGSPSILFVGSNFQRGGLPALIKAVSNIRKTSPEVSLYVAGEDIREHEMKSLAKSLDAEENVHFLGRKDNKEIRAFINQTDILVKPSMTEGFGLVFLEAMSVGTPVIGGNTGGTPELINDGQNGFLVEPGDWQTLAKKIQLIATDKELKGKIIEEGFRTFKSFSIDRMIEETVEVYTNLIKTG